MLHGDILLRCCLLDEVHARDSLQGKMTGDQPQEPELAGEEALRGDCARRSWRRRPLFGLKPHHLCASSSGLVLPTEGAWLEMV